MGAKRKEVREVICGISDHLYGDLDSFISYLQKIKTDNSGYIRYVIDDDYDYDETKNYFIYGIRLENDIEYKSRRKIEKAKLEMSKLASERKRAEDEIKEKEEYERLKKKFEK